VLALGLLDNVKLGVSGAPVPRQRKPSRAPREAASVFARVADTERDRTEWLKSKTCFSCGVLGHLRQDCPHRNKETAPAATRLPPPPQRAKGQPKSALRIGGPARAKDANARGFTTSFAILSGLDSAEEDSDDETDQSKATDPVELPGARGDETDQSESTDSDYEQLVVKAAASSTAKEVSFSVDTKQAKPEWYGGYGGYGRGFGRGRGGGSGGRGRFGVAGREELAELRAALAQAEQRTVLADVEQKEYAHARSALPSRATPNSRIVRRGEFGSPGLNVLGTTFERVKMCVDSGADEHVFPDKMISSEVTPCEINGADSSHIVSWGGGTKSFAAVTGIVAISAINGQPGGRPIELPGAWGTGEVTTPLISVPRLIKAGAVVHYEKGTSYIDLSAIGGGRITIDKNSMIFGNVEGIKKDTGAGATVGSRARAHAASAVGMTTADASPSKVHRIGSPSVLSLGLCLTS